MFVHILKNAALRLFPIVLFFALAACSGGGGGGGQGTDPFASAPGLDVSPGSLTFSTVENGPVPAIQNIQATISDTNAAQIIVGYPVGTTPPSWLSLNLAGSGYSWTVTAGITGPIPPIGKYTANIRVVIARSDNSTIAYRDVQVTFDVLAPGNPGTTSGSLDGSFGAGGVALFTRGGVWKSMGRGIAVDNSDRVLVTGYLSDRMALWRYTAGGVLDSTFGNYSGYTFESSLTGYDQSQGEAVAIDGLGRILVAGYRREFPSGNYKAFVWRFNSDGTSNAIFSIPTTSSVNGWNAAYGVAIDGNGRIVVVGAEQNATGGTDGVVWRLTDSGILDTTFGADYNTDTIPDGYIKFTGTAYSGANDTGYAVKIDSSQRIVVAGYSGNYPQYADMIVWRFTSSGGIDASFGVDYGGNGTPDGYYKHHVGNTATYDVARSLAIDSVGRIIVAGNSFDYSNNYYDMLTLRLTANGVLDTSFGGNYDGIPGPDGYIRYDRTGSDDLGTGVVVDSNGRVTVTGFTAGSSNWDVTVWRYTSSGSPDTGFGVNGVTIYDSPPATGADQDRAFAIAQDSHGRFVVTGSSIIGTSTIEIMTLYRFLP